MAIKNIEIERVDDWDNLRYKINRYFAYWPNYVFRGQAQHDWLLESTLTRALKKVKETDKTNLVKEHLDRFKLEIRGKRGDSARTLGEDELWALGQHHGLLTPLLDWTESPWIALFFSLAYTERSSTGYRTLWALNRDDISVINELNEKKGLKKEKIRIIEPLNEDNNRLISQKGLFTKMGIEDDLENWVKDSESPGDWITLYKIEYPDELREKLLRYLNLMNVNFSSLFPDLYGSSLNMNLRLMSTDSIAEYQDKDWKGLISDDE